MNETCNCPWLQCTVHVGQLCSNEATQIPCSVHDQCRAPHYIGDRIFGQGIHLCVDCGEAMLELLVNDVSSLMAKIHIELPPTYRATSEILSTYFTAMTQPTGPWPRPIRDVFGILGFVVLCGTADAVSTEHLEQAFQLSERVRSLRHAFKGTNPEKEED